MQQGGQQHRHPSIATLRRASAVVGLADLPDDPLAIVLGMLCPRDMLAASACSRSWHLASSRRGLWRELGQRMGVTLPPRRPRSGGAVGVAAASGRRSTRLSTNLKRAFFVGWVRQQRYVSCRIYRGADKFATLARCCAASPGARCPAGSATAMA
jgi:hypothetical protein